VQEYEATREIAFASPGALLEARMIAEMDKARPLAAAIRGAAFLTDSKPWLAK
jgi:hypothetical protein